MSEQLTIRQASAAWLDHIQTRRRRPVKASSAATFKSYISKWVEPYLGSLGVEQVNVAVLRDFIRQLDEAGLSAKSQVEISSAVKSIIASVVDEEGEPLYTRRWDNERLDLPEVIRSEQHTPIVTRKQIEEVIEKSSESYQCLYAILAGAGLRIGEALCMRLQKDDTGTSTVFDAASAVVRVRKSLWRTTEGTPKTPASIRDVCLPRELADFLVKRFERREGYAFGNGRAPCVSTMRAHLDQAIRGAGVGFHAFRRFFVSHRRAMGMSEELLKAQVGHATSDITSRYSRFGTGAEYDAQRRAEVERCGLGFALPETK